MDAGHPSKAAGASAIPSEMCGQSTPLPSGCVRDHDTHGGRHGTRCMAQRHGSAAWSSTRRPVAGEHCWTENPTIRWHHPLAGSGSSSSWRIAMCCKSRRPLTIGLTILCLGGMPSVAMAADLDRNTLAERVTKLSRSTQWKPVSALPIAFPTYHPQGMVKIGDAFFVSSVEIKEPTKRYSQPIDGYDRDTGAGIGHLFKIDPTGHLASEITLGEGSIYHPGGLDYDGQYIWVPVAEYRPNSRSVVYRVDPETMKAEEMFRFAD